MSGTDSDRARNAYFRAIETTFIRLRGAPLLLSPADWQTAREWHRQGIPLEVVCDVLESVFEGVRRRDPQRRISSLRYCAPAVEEAWREICDLTAAGHRLEPQHLDVAARLTRLTAALPEELPSLDPIRAALGDLDGPAETVEEELGEIDRQMLEAVAADLDAETRAEISERARAALQRALDRMGTAQPDQDLEGRLYREFLRRHLGLPTLSLFSGGVDDSSD